MCQRCHRSRTSGIVHLPTRSACSRPKITHQHILLILSCAEHTASPKDLDYFEAYRASPSCIWLAGSCPCYIHTLPPTTNVSLCSLLRTPWLCALRGPPVYRFVQMESDDDKGIAGGKVLEPHKERGGACVHQDGERRPQRMACP